MNKRLFWTTAALLTTALGTLLSSHADSSEAGNNPSRVDRQPNPNTAPSLQPPNVVKVGEYQSPAGAKASDKLIARIQPHELAGHQAATLYVRNIPVLTFSSSEPVITSGTKVGAVGDGRGVESQASVATDDSQTTNPVWRATAVAAKLNQLNLAGINAGTITVSWKAGGEPISSKNVTSKQSNSDRYLIKVNSALLVEINAQTKLPDTTKDLAKDALQATNRLRRLLGNAPPLGEISGKPVPPKMPQAVLLPKLPKQISVGPVRISLSGMASWYGPGFHGNRSASGERYNQNALTAAHRSLPFGTKVRVTNTRTGHSVVVRINDRGPHVRGRILDLSAAAARMLGVMQTGVAPVRVDVLSNQRSKSAKQL